ncbi:MAG: hypothetical protein NTV93_21055 [Verrucomicrobia bacterium]|nr:hypothetical protein [Verrucomicrobiota bacterium]
MKLHAAFTKAFFFSASLLILAATTKAAPNLPVIYVDTDNGNDGNTGTEATTAFKTLTRAGESIAPSGTIHLVSSKTPFRECLELKVGGVEGQPLTVEGNGAVIDLGTDLADGPWEQLGEEWVLARDVRPHTRTVQTSPIFIDNTPIWVASEKDPKDAPVGSLRFLDNGRYVIKFPPGKSPRNSRVTLTSEENTPGVLFGANASHIIVRNLTARYVGNDGFNLHGAGQDIVLENVKALMCGDQGISSHDTGQMTVRGAEIAFCGSRAGGIADINQCTTSYSNVLMHHNRKGVLTLRGGHHEIDGMAIIGNSPGALPKSTDKISVKNCVILNDSLSEIACSAETDREEVKGLIESARQTKALLDTVPYPGVPVLRKP